MKKLTVTILFTGIAFLSFGQADLKIIEVDWEVGGQKELYDNIITRHAGRNDYNGILNVGYRTLPQYLKNSTAVKGLGLLYPSKVEAFIEGFKRMAKGGVVYIFLARNTVDAANMAMYTVVIKDGNDEKILFTQSLDDVLPTALPGDNTWWWNYTSVPISVPVGGRFFIYIIAHYWGDNTVFKFEVDTIDL